MDAAAADGSPVLYWALGELDVAGVAREDLADCLLMRQVAHCVEINQCVAIEQVLRRWRGGRAAIQHERAVKFCLPHRLRTSRTRCRRRARSRAPRSASCAAG